MIYIKLEEKNEDSKTKLKFFKEKIYNIKNKFMKLKEDKFENIVLITLPNLKNTTLNKLSKYIKVHCINKICLSNSLLENNVFMEFIKNENVKILDGKWLFKHLIIDCAEYICTSKKEDLSYQEISILSKDINEIVIDAIRNLAPKVRILNVITFDENKFRKIERELYEQKGIILNMNNNYKKSLMKSDIIFNFDFFEDDINKYTLPKRTCIVNFNDEIKINSKSFEGINANFFDIQMPRKYLKNSIYLKDFNTSILYESYIYKRTSPQNIINEIEKDGVDITFLNGKNGRIRKNEYLNLTKKIAN